MMTKCSNFSFTHHLGRHSMSDEQIAENIIELLKQLGTLHPGGSNNIYKLHLKPNVNISVAVPIYINTGKLFRIMHSNSHIRVCLFRSKNCTGNFC